MSPIEAQTLLRKVEDARYFALALRAVAVPVCTTTDDINNLEMCVGLLIRAEECALKLNGG